MDGDWIYLPIPIVAALAAAVAATPLARRFARRFRVLAYPDAERRFHPAPTPLLGGVAVYAALAAGLVAALALGRFRHAELAQLCGALLPTAALACLFGAVDDCRNLRWRAKIALQLVAALTIAASGYSVDFIVVFGYRIELGLWGVALTTFWLMGCINALNLIDGLDGLASVVGLSTASMMGIIAWNMGNGHVAVASLALAAALAGFLLYNRPPASIFLGDSGSTVIGLMIGVLSIQGSLKSSATLSITAPVVLMTLPMFDVVMAVVRRKLMGRPLALGDREHIHHCLLDRGLGPWQVLGIVGALCLTTGAAATAATVFRKDALAWIIATMLVVLMIRLRVFGHREFGLIDRFVRKQAVNLSKNLTHAIFLPHPQATQRVPPRSPPEIVLAARVTADATAEDTASAAPLRTDVAVAATGAPAAPACGSRVGNERKVRSTRGTGAPACGSRVAGQPHAALSKPTVP